MHATSAMTTPSATKTQVIIGRAAVGAFCAGIGGEYAGGGAYCPGAGGVYAGAEGKLGMGLPHRAQKRAPTRSELPQYGQA